MHTLASFTLEKLVEMCAASNSLACGRLGSAAVRAVVHAQQQVVSGTNYVLEVDTSAGQLHFEIYEQAWSSTLELKKASLKVNPAEEGLSMLQGESRLDIGFAAFNERLSTASTASTTVATTVATTFAPMSTTAAAKESTLLGGYKLVDEVGEGSRMHTLASFTLEKLVEMCAASNSLACGRLGSAAVRAVVHAQQQVVSGTNYVLEVDTSAGQLHFEIYEQAWSSTLELKKASLKVNPAEEGLSMLQGESRLDIGFASFNALLATPRPTEATKASAGAKAAGQSASLFVARSSQSPPSPPLPRDSSTQWWVFGFFVIGVAVIFTLATAMRHFQVQLPTETSGTASLNTSTTASDAKEMMVDLPKMTAKGDNSIA